MSEVWSCGFGAQALESTNTIFLRYGGCFMRKQRPVFCAKASKGAHPSKSLGAVVRTRMNADHADLNPRVSGQIRVPFGFGAFFKHPNVRDEFSDWPD